MFLRTAIHVLVPIICKSPFCKDFLPGHIRDRVVDVAGGDMHIRDDVELVVYGAMV